MKPVEQTITKHDPENGQYGDCFRACIASVLHLNIEEVPHFADKTETFKEAMVPCQEFLSRYNLSIISYMFKADSAEEIIDLQKQASCWSVSPLTYIIGGISPRGHSHVVVANTAGDFHDPHPESRGSAEIQLSPYKHTSGYKYFTVDWFVVLDTPACVSGN